MAFWILNKILLFSERHNTKREIIKLKANKIGGKKQWQIHQKCKFQNGKNVLQPFALIQFLWNIIKSQKVS